MPAVKLKGKPLCAQCGREVDELTEFYDDWMARVRYRAACHGQSEIVDVDVETLAWLGDKGVRFGVAFAGPPRLGDGNAQG